MSKELLLKLAEDYSMLAEDLKKLAAGENPAESKKEERTEVPFAVEEKKEPPKQEKKLLVKHGANRLSEIKPEDYAVLMEEAENL